jgi:hypothetical protein
VYIETAEDMTMKMNMKTIIIIIFKKNDIETELQLNNIVYVFKMSFNLFLLTVIYDKSFETRITSDYGLRIFYKETLVANIMKISRGLFYLKTSADVAFIKNLFAAAYATTVAKSRKLFINI